MEEKILSEGKVLPGGILKVGSFLNQQLDMVFFKEMAKEIARLFTNDKVTKILTVEASGIAIAVAAGLEMNIPVVFAKKHQTTNLDGGVYCANVYSFTHGTTYQIVVSEDYLNQNDTVLLVDDFLANGKALEGLCEIVSQANSSLAGAAIAIEKHFQGGGAALRSKGIRIESLAKIKSMGDDGSIEFF